MKRSGKITDEHINEMMKKGDLDGDGWETILEREVGVVRQGRKKLNLEMFSSLTPTPTPSLSSLPHIS